ncbi:MAG: hypothetical protein JNJ43_15490 [Anaerolineales bacterium]|nr:hypothetical protein [Anaerolineales bacterium]
MKSKFDPQKHHRKSIRLKGYDYSSEGAYFVTIVVHGRECLFGEIVNGEMILNEYGKIVQKWWDEIPIHFPNVELGAFIIMPNHIHAIIFITTERRGEVLSPCDNPNYNNQNINVDGNNQLGGETPPLHKPNSNIQNIYVDETNQQGAETAPLRKPTLGQIIAYFKYQSTKEMNRIETKDVITKFWQRNYYEHIIRDEKDLQSKTDYININPSLWDEDDNNPKNNL